VRPPQRMGVAGARNYGASWARGDLLVFADAHVDPDQGWLRRIATAFTDPGVAAVAPAVSRVDDRRVKGYGFTWRDSTLSVRWLTRRAPAPVPVPFLCGCFICVRRDDFEAVGGFDEGLRTWGYEDAEICLNLWRRGRQCMVVPEVEVAHLFRPSFPYAFGMVKALHNRMRLAAVHLPQQAVESVVAAAGGQDGFPQAYRDLLTTDVWARREQIDRVAVRSGAWFLDQFRLQLA